MANIKEKLDKYLAEKIIEEKIEDVFGERFGRYSKYIIQERAIPDIRDGLKPVQRRILFGMYKLGIFSDKPFKKSARIVGEVMGKYHPHGDSSIYDALTRMSQSWKMRVPLIEMHGNNGSIDGDSAAAMRYTEARLSKEAELLIESIDKRTVDLVPNFDDEELEPTVLPAKFPNFLVNGTTGISAGYATDVPPHNLNEIVAAAIYRIDNPSCPIEDLLNIVQGPDFPTGGIVQGIDGIKDAFSTGKGKIVIRSKTEIEEISKGQLRIVVKEIPYEVNKANLVKRIDLIRIDKKIEGILEVRDESDRDGLRIAIDLKKGANAEFILNYLLKNSDLQINYSYNMTAIYNKRPVLVTLPLYLDAYINHQKEIITNRSNFDLAKAKKRLHIVDGLIKMVSVIDDVIRIIKGSKNKGDSKANLIKEFDFSEEQAEAIVTLQLYRLSSTDVSELEKEQKTLNTTIKYLIKILSNEHELLGVIKQELKDISVAFSDQRLTEIKDSIETIKRNKEELISVQQVMVSVSKFGYVKRSSLRSFNSTPAPGLKENDGLIFKEELSTLKVILLFTNLGNYIYLPVYEIEDQKWKDLGTYISNIVPIEKNERIIRVISVKNFNVEAKLLFATKLGSIKQTLLSEFNVTRYSKPIKAMKMTSDDELVSVDITKNYNEIIMLSLKGRMLRYRENEITLVGQQAGGIKGINLAPDDYVTASFYTRTNNDALILTSRGNVKRVKITDIPLSKRNKVGTVVIREIKGNPHLIVDGVSMSYIQYREDVDVSIITEKGSMIVKAFNMKYSVNDSGNKVVSDNSLGISLRIFIALLEDDEIYTEETTTPSIINAVQEEEKKSTYDEGLFAELDVDEQTPEDDTDDPRFEKFRNLSIFDDEIL